MSGNFKVKSSHLLDYTFFFLCSSLPIKIVLSPPSPDASLNCLIYIFFMFDLVLFMINFVHRSVAYCYGHPIAISFYVCQHM